MQKVIYGHTQSWQVRLIVEELVEKIARQYELEQRDGVTGGISHKVGQAARAAINARLACNARLIAAAPDLLEALQRIMPKVEAYMLRSDGWQSGENYEAIEFARAAIRKARGEE